VKHSIITPILLLVAASGCSRDAAVTQGAPRDSGGRVPQAAASATAEPVTPGTLPAGSPALDAKKAAARAAAPEPAATKDDAAPATAPETEAAAAARFSHAAPFDPATVPDFSIVAKPGKSILEGLPGVVLPKDPERDFVTAHGRRDAPVIATPLKGGKASADDLARAILAAIADNDYKGVHLLRITEEEFDDIFWPEFPQSRPMTNIKAEDAWFLHVAECDDGVKELLEREAGQQLVFDRLDCMQGRMRYRNFDLYAGMVIVAHRPDGTVVRLRHAWTFVERLGQWKVYMYDDRTHGEFLQDYPPTE
jgi:hypothetical protein